MAAWEETAASLLAVGPGWQALLALKASVAYRRASSDLQRLVMVGQVGTPLARRGAENLVENLAGGPGGLAALPVSREPAGVGC